MNKDLFEGTYKCVINTEETPRLAGSQMRKKSYLPCNYTSPF